MAVYALFLADAARSTGYPVVEVAGWGNRGHGPMRAIEGVMGHHTATPESVVGDYPSLRIVRDGRAGLSGPLCNLGLGRSGTIYVVAGGTAYHAGVSRFGGFTDLNDEFLGIEAEDSGDGVWTDAMRDCYPKLVAALLRYINRGVDRYCSHRTAAYPPGRKPDPANLSDAWMREQAARWLNAPPPRPTGDTHTVVAGETLWSISRRFGCSVPELMSWNNLTTDAIKPGQTLRVRPATPVPPANSSLVISSTTNSRHPEVRYFQTFMNRVFPSYRDTPLSVDGEYGPACTGACKQFQRASAIGVDGVLGPTTRGALARHGYRP